MGALLRWRNPYTISEKKRSLAVRLIYVHSTADEKTCRAMRQKYTEAIRGKLEKLRGSVHSGRLKDVQAVHKQILKAYGRKSAQKYFSYDVSVLTPEQRQALPKPVNLRKMGLAAGAAGRGAVSRFADRGKGRCRGGGAAVRPEPRSPSRRLLLPARSKTMGSEVTRRLIRGRLDRCQGW